MKQVTWVFLCLSIVSCSSGTLFVPLESNPCDSCEEGEVCSQGECISPIDCEELGGVVVKGGGACQLCGDFEVVGTEECDDGEETEFCNSDCTFTECGDAIVNFASGEECDDGENNGRYQGCTKECTISPYCGGDSAAVACDDHDACTVDACSYDGCTNTFSSDLCHHLAFDVAPMKTVFVGMTWPTFSVRVENSLGYPVNISSPVTLVLSGALNRTIEATLVEGGAYFSTLAAFKIGAVSIEASVPLIGSTSRTVAVIDPSPECKLDDDCDLGFVCNENWGICALPNCKSQPDFTPCEVITDPDRSYDICLGGKCESPGCGEGNCNSPGPNFKIPDTGAVLCYGEDSEIPCPSEEEAYYLQDAQQGWDFTHSAPERFSIDVSSGNKVITDTITNLMWEGCTQGYDNCSDLGGVCGPMCDWSESIAYCDSLMWGGYTDWRLPNSQELLSIIDYRHLTPALDKEVFDDLGVYPGAMYWTSDSSLYEKSMGLTVDFRDGETSVQDKSHEIPTRCVRGRPHLINYNRFEKTEGAYPTVLDTTTGLMWQGCLASSNSVCNPNYTSKYRWDGALFYCENLEWGGYSDWRLPNVKETHSLINHRERSRVDSTMFPMVSNQSLIWTSTPSPKISGGSSTKKEAWRALFGSYDSISSGSKEEMLEVMCVRDP